MLLSFKEKRKNSGGCILLFTWLNKGHFSSLLKWIRLHFCPCVCVCAANILGAAIFHSSLLVVPWKDFLKVWLFYSKRLDIVANICQVHATKRGEGSRVDLFVVLWFFEITWGYHKIKHTCLNCQLSHGESVTFNVYDTANEMWPAFWLGTATG